MASNPAADYGTDLACVYDAGDDFGTVTGLDLVRQDAIHRLLTDSVLGPEDDAADWGFDVRRLLGAPNASTSTIGPTLSEVLTRDPRILTADVTVDVDDGGLGLTVSATCTTALGPFDLVLPISAVTGDLITTQGR